VRKKCPVPFPAERPFGCFAEKVPDTYFPLTDNASRFPRSAFVLGILTRIFRILGGLIGNEFGGRFSVGGILGVLR
jgi:hypothetical protein